MSSWFDQVDEATPADSAPDGGDQPPYEVRRRGAARGRVTPTVVGLIAVLVALVLIAAGAGWFLMSSRAEPEPVDASVVVVSGGSSESPSPSPVVEEADPEMLVSTRLSK